MAKGNASADALLAELIAEKQALAVTTGSLQVLIALASVTTMVTVDTSANPPKVDPVDIANRTFKDIGLDNAGVAAFKANLSILLDFIAADIAKLPDKNAMNIGKVMEFVRLSILATP